MVRTTTRCGSPILTKRLATARIIALADTFDAITTNRPYRRARSTEIALYELHNEAGKQFDPALVKIFAEHITAFL